MAATALDSQSPGAIRAKRYRKRRKDGILLVRIQVEKDAIVQALLERGFLAAGKHQDADIGRGICEMLNIAYRTGVRNG